MAFGENLFDSLKREAGAAKSPVWIGKWRDTNMDLIVHRNDDVLFLEWEPVELATDRSRFLSKVQGLLARLEACQDVMSLTDTMTREIHQLFGIDRVMIYRFLPDWSGEVIAETADPKLDVRYFGLRFPATDIPAPARAVYQKVWIRVIQEARAEPAGITPLTDPRTNAPLDMTYSFLRAVSPMHVEYLSNIGVVGSVSCSLRVRGKLWGLVACHQYEPLILRHTARAALELIAQVVSFRIEQLLELETAEERKELSRVLESISERFERNEDVNLWLALPSLTRVLDCCGVAISEPRGWLSLGDVPTEDELSEISRLVKLHLQSGEGTEDGRLFYTDRLGQMRNLPDSKHCGLFAMAPAGLEGDFVLWFRHSESKNVRWAGDPSSKEIRYGPSGPRLHPRASFAEYIETTSERSETWTAFDVWKANQFLRTLDTASARQARRMSVLNQTLQHRNEELDAFAYMASHDLREPLRGIHNYAHFLKEDFAEVLTPSGNSMLNGLLGLTLRMESLITSLLSYSRLTHQELDQIPCSVRELAQEAVTLLESTTKIKGVIQVDEDLPWVLAHRPFLAEVIGNLLSNAVKYSDEGRQIRVGRPQEIAPEGFATFFVKDNGIGIDPEFHERVFLLFRRLHTPEERGGGSGAGLTIVRRIVQRHGGKVWLESAPGQGTTVFVSLPAANPPH